MSKNVHRIFPTRFVKYPNRRVYDTLTGRYTTVLRIVDLLLAGERVTERASCREVTAEVLGEALWQDVREGRGPSREDLIGFIRAYRAVRMAASEQPAAS